MDETEDLQILFPYAKDSFFTRLYELYPASGFNSTLFQRQTIFGNYIVSYNSRVCGAEDADGSDFRSTV